MADMAQINWKAIDADPRFQTLHRKKTMFLWGLMVFSMVYYFLLPIGAAYFQDLFRIKVWGPVNVGILFALSSSPLHYARPRPIFRATWALFHRNSRKRRPQSPRRPPLRSCPLLRPFHGRPDRNVARPACPR